MEANQVSSNWQMDKPSYACNGLLVKQVVKVYWYPLWHAWVLTAPSQEAGLKRLCTGWLCTSQAEKAKCWVWRKIVGFQGFGVQLTITEQYEYTGLKNWSPSSLWRALPNFDTFVEAKGLCWEISLLPLLSFLWQGRWACPQSNLKVFMRTSGNTLLEVWDNIGPQSSHLISRGLQRFGVRIRPLKWGTIWNYPDRSQIHASVWERGK